MSILTANPTTFSEIKARVISQSGRDDLVDAAGVDVGLGVGFYVSCAQRLLDGLQQHTKQTGRHTEQLAAGDYYKTIPYSMDISEVRIADAIANTVLTNVPDIQELKGYYNRPVADLTRGEPRFYSMNVIRVAPSQSTYLVEESFDNTFDTADLDFSHNMAYAGILFYPPSDQAYTMQIEGRWYEAPLGDDVAAIGTVTFAAIPTIGDKITIGSTTWEWNVDIVIGIDIAACTLNLATKINTLTNVTADDTATTVVVTAVTVRQW